MKNQVQTSLRPRNLNNLSSFMQSSALRPVLYLFFPLTQISGGKVLGKESRCQGASE